MILQDFRDAEHQPDEDYPIIMGQRTWEKSQLQRVGWQQVDTSISCAGCEDLHSSSRTGLVNLLYSASAPGNLHVCAVGDI